jgi:hypothetical protein
MSAKNELQELYQRRKETLPVYSTERVRGTPAHSPLWISTVTLHDGTTYSGSPYTKKGAAEISAAEVALLYVPGEVEVKVPDSGALESAKDVARWCEDRTAICLIDIENIPQAVSMDQVNIPRGVFVLGFVGHCHPMALKPFPFSKYIVKSSIADAADHALTFMAGYIASHLVSEDLGEELTPLPKIIIMSRDHYAEATVWCLKQQGFIAYHVTSVPELTKHF